MPSLFGIFGSANPSARNSSQSLLIGEEEKHLQSAVKAITKLLDDDVNGAEEELVLSESVYHKLGLGLVMFMRATIGYERDVMGDASARLATTEVAAMDALRCAQRDPNAFRSKIYPLGMEYTLCHAEAQTMGAVIGVLTESLTEALKGFFKIRKAVFALESIAVAEKEFLSKIRLNGAQPSNPVSTPGSGSQPFASLGGHPVMEGKDKTSNTTHDRTKVDDHDDDDDHDDGDGDDDGDIFVDVQQDSIDKNMTEKYHGHFETNGIITDASNLSPNNTSYEQNQPGDLREHTLNNSKIDSSFLKNPIDQFIHSGYCFHQGLLLLALSLIPPTFSRILSVIGFRGNREQGINLLWEATGIPADGTVSNPTFSNGNRANAGSYGLSVSTAAVHAGMAGLIVSGYYSGLVSSLDILPSTKKRNERCKSLIREMRSRFPNSKLWLLEEARMAASEQCLHEAADLLESSPGQSELKQVEALRWFEHAHICMYLHEYEKCAESFVKCVDLNNWSHALYYYTAGAAHVELYRNAKYRLPEPDLEAAEKHAVQAEEYFSKVPDLAGKKKIFSRQLQSDVFVNKKVGKWQKRSEETGVRLVDAIGVSPLLEMTFFWSGYRKMDTSLLQKSLERLWWSDGGARDISAPPSKLTPETPFAKKFQPDPHFDKYQSDEYAVLALLRGTIYRRFGDTATAREILKREIIDKYKWAEFKGAYKDNWPAPISRYEMAACAWHESERSAAPTNDDKETRKDLLHDCSRYLQEVSAWESYDMEIRMGIKVSTGKETLKNLGIMP